MKWNLVLLLILTWKKSLLYRKPLQILSKKKIILSAHDDAFRKDSFLFGEGQSRVVVSVDPGNLLKLKEKFAATGMPYTVLGTVTPGNVNIDLESWGEIDDWKNQYGTAIENLLKGHESEHALTAL